MNPVKRLLHKLRHVFRSAKSGRFVSEDYAREHPDTTERETER